MLNYIFNIYLYFYRYKIRSKEFAIISDNCWGGEIYKCLNMQFNTPFIGLFIDGKNYIKLLENFSFYLDQPLVFRMEENTKADKINHPIGYLDDVEIHFLHYSSNIEAMKKWNRRVKRLKDTIHFDNCYFKIDDRDDTSVEILNRFHDLKFKNKISFGIQQLDNKNHISILENEDSKFVPDGVKLFFISLRYINIFNWIITSNFQYAKKSRLKILIPIK